MLLLHQQQLCLVSEIRTLLIFVCISDTGSKVILDQRHPKSVRDRECSVCQHKDDKALAIYDSVVGSLSVISLEAPKGDHMVATKEVKVSIAFNAS
jgi:hypothetical protein